MKPFNQLIKILFPLTLFIVCHDSLAQTQIFHPGRKKFLSTNNSDLFGEKYSFVENVGQYDETINRYGYIDKVLFAYEGLDMPVLFTKKGIIHLLRKKEKKSFEGKEKEDRSGITEDELGYSGKLRNRIIAMEWLNANPNPEVLFGKSNEVYHTYSMLKVKAKSFNNITFKDLYPGIDLVYYFTDNPLCGFEYKLIVQPNADLSKVRFKYSGDVKRIKEDSKGNLIIKSDINDIIQNLPVAYCENKANKTEPSNFLPINFVKKGNVIGFDFSQKTMRDQTIIVDPFVTNTSNLTGTLVSFATDVDFDYNGNVYVSGGGDRQNHKLAKFDKTGNLLWTFTGSVSNPSWQFGPYYGGWAVEKTTGKVYLGQGLTDNGDRIIRIDANGIYDNYVSDTIKQLSECWKIVWRPNGSNSQVLVGGGGVVSSNSLAVLTPPSTIAQVTNLTGVTSLTNQDVSDMVIDGDQLYALFSSQITTLINGKIRKYDPPYSNATEVWANTQLPIFTFERKNRPYMYDATSGSDETETSTNTIAVNTSYVFVWNGEVLKAHDKVTGNLLGFINLGITPLFVGGIYVNDCNNVFIGDRDRIRVLSFNGTTFNDAAQPDIFIPNFSYRPVWDLAYDSTNKLLYACGNGFVGSFDVSAYGAPNPYSIVVKYDCGNPSAVATIFPTPPPGSTMNYSLYDGNTLITSNNTGIFSGLTTTQSYSVKATISNQCGILYSQAFTLGNPTLSLTKVDACPNNLGSIAVNGSGGISPYLYSIDGTNFQNSNIFTGVPTGNYTITIKDANGCTNTNNVIVTQINNCLSASATASSASCSSNSGSITVNAIDGLFPYSYSLDGINFQSSNVFSDLPPGKYKITVKDAAGTMNILDATVPLINNLKANGNPTSETCIGKDGTINLSANGVTGVVQYSLDGVNFQLNNMFLNLSSGPYDVIARDAANCTDTIKVVVPFTNTLLLNAGGDKTICEGSGIVLGASSNGNNFLWAPATGLDNFSKLNPMSSPIDTTKYRIKASLGICTEQDSLMVFVISAPVAYAGIDTTICRGQSVQLKGSGGIFYSWSPSVYLNNAYVPDPIVTKLLRNTIFYLTVKNGDGCQSLHPDTVVVNVIEKLHVFAGNDTAVLINNPVQLQAIDLNNNSVSFSWSPSSGLDNANVSNPIATLNSDMVYTVTGYTAEGCMDTDTLDVKVYSKAEIYVPSAFTPNGDNKNDQLKAFPFGIKEFKYFTVYNRWGQIVFSTVDYHKGWDGLLGGLPQSSAIFTWIAKGIDFKGNVIERKGTVLLIR